MFLLGGGGPPREVMTGPMQTISDAMPLSHLVGGLRQSWLGATDDPHFLLWPVLVAVVATALAVRAAEPCDTGTMTTTLHWVNADVEVHKVVVGPYDNNVFVVRCRRTGDAVLIDAANEHEQLLELCQRLGVRRVLETHGHWDHIQAVPAIREAGYEVAVTELDAPKLKDVGYDVFIERHRRRSRSATCGWRRSTTPATRPGRSRSTCAARRCCSRGDTLFPGGPGNTSFDDADFGTIIQSIESRLFTFPDTTVVLPGHGVDTTIGAERPHLDEWIARGW